MILENNSLIVADVHYKNSDMTFLDFINDILDKKFEFGSIYLVGDIFDLLIGSPSRYFNNSYNKKLVDAINSLSNSYKIYYLEGNHDFLLDYFFNDNIYIVPIEKQPLEIRYKDKNILLSHGDCFIDSFIYPIYIKIVRNRTLISILDFFNSIFNGKVASFISNLLIKDKGYFLIENFKDISKKRVNKYKDNGYKNFNYCIEGHYHQGISYQFDDISYINIPPFTGNFSYIHFNNGEFTTKKYIK